MHGPLNVKSRSYRIFFMFTHDSPSCVVTSSDLLLNEPQAKSLQKRQHPLSRSSTESCPSPYHNGIRERRGIAPLILSTGTTGDVDSRPGNSTPGGKASGTYWTEAGWASQPFWTFGGQISCLCRESNLGFSGVQPLSQWLCRLRILIF